MGSFTNSREKKYTWLGAALLAVCLSCRAQHIPALLALVKRRVPALSGKVVFETIRTLREDTACYYTKDHRLVIRASGTIAAARALDDYLRTYCGTSFSHTGDQVNIPATLPIVKKAVPVAAHFHYRYALNYCTYNYTMSFWNWKQWEHELDWMALSGVNLMLAPQGTEEIWQHVLRDIGYSPGEIEAYLPGPAFNAWWMMGNIQGWGGPVSSAMIHCRTVLQQRILKRMHALGIQPVLQGFCGMVPSTITRHYPHAQVVDQGNWGDGFRRPVFLLPQDSLFHKISDLYYQYLHQLYGKAVFLGGDLFHEGGHTGSIDLGATAAAIQADMQRHCPGSTWILQAWQDNPKKAFLDGLDPHHVLVLDLRGDAGHNWEQSGGYSGYPWIWCAMVNGGGTVGMEGRLVRILTEPERAQKTAAGRCMQGIGIVPEGIDNNDVMYSSLLLSAWQKPLVSIDGFLKRYITARYGRYDADVEDAWQFLLQSAYISHTGDMADAWESIFCARPDTNLVTSVSTWGPKKLPYDSVIFYKAAACFAKAVARFRHSATYRHDLVDIWRQVIALKARQPYDRLMTAYEQRDAAAFEKNKGQFLGLLHLQNRWLATEPAFCLHTWLQAARDLLPAPADKALAVWNAKVQITYWGPATNPATLVHDYANKEWSGLLEDFYLPRWQAFFDYAEKRIQGASPAWPDFFSMEKSWTERPGIPKAPGREDCIRLLPVIEKATGE